MILDTQTYTYAKDYNKERSELPAVTRILSATKPEEDRKALEDWRKRVGDKEANRILDESNRFGTQVHDNVEAHIKGKTFPKCSVYAQMTSNKLIKEFVEKEIDVVYGIETWLYHSNLYKGIADLVCMYDGELVLVDLKTARRAKKEEYINDYKLQVSAYAMAHDEQFGTNIQKTKIVIANMAGSYQKFEVNNTELEEKKFEWVQRLEQYMEQV